MENALADADGDAVLVIGQRFEGVELRGQQLLLSLSELRRWFEPAARSTGRTPGRTHHGMMPERPNTAAIALHDEVARAIRMRDEEAAETAMRAIIDEAAIAVAQDLSSSMPR